MKLYSLDEITDEFVGKRGTPERELFEQELQLEVLSAAIKQLREERNLTQQQLSELVGVQKSQISRLERDASSVKMQTVLKVFTALKATVSFKVMMQQNRAA
jgi:DNA-binding XRE family transcriptional regulator